MPTWQRLAVFGAVLLVTAVVARLLDRAIVRRHLDPAQRTRYRVLRRSVTTLVGAIGLLSALLVIPQVRAVAGVLLAFSQPLRLGDRVEVGGVAGEVEEIGLTYTFIRADEATRLVIPNEKLASEAIRNATIRSQRTLAQVSVEVPLGADLGRVIELLGRELPEDGDVLVTGLDGTATVTARAWVGDPLEAERAASALRLRAHERLREAKVFA